MKTWYGDSKIIYDKFFEKNNILIFYLAFIILVSSDLGDEQSLIEH